MDLLHKQPLLSSACLDVTAQGDAVSDRYGDIYFSRSGGFAEKHHVFVAGNALPERFQSGISTRVLEFGFGAGLSFLATAHALLQTVRPAHRRAPELHYFSIEKHPLSRSEIVRLIQPWPMLRPLAEELVGHWPERLPGFHRRYLAGGRIALTLIFGDVADVLPQVEGVFDVFFLDGFSPRRNADMWSDSVFRHLRRLSAPGARASTYSSARVVADGLAAAGFSVARAPGFGSKKHMLTGVRAGDAPSMGRPEADSDRLASAVIVGAGVAGLTMARALARRGVSVQVFDRAATLGAGGSGNVAGIVSPVISRDWNLRSQLTALGLGYLRTEWAALQEQGSKPKGAFPGVIQLGRNPQHVTRQSDIADALQLDPEFARWLSAEELSIIGGAPVTMPGWYFPQAGWLVPGDYLQAMADHPLIQLNLGVSVEEIQPQGGTWLGLSGAGQVVFTTDRLVLANATALEGLLPDVGKYITPCRGQVSASMRRNACTGPDIIVPLMREGYGLDLPDGLRVFGASFKSGDPSLEVRLAEQRENAVRLASISPELGRSLPPVNTWQARVSLRATTPDRLPMVGRVDRVGMGPLYVTAGHGSRGFTWCALLAETLAAAMLDEPSPMPKALRHALDPGRFARRAARRAGQPDEC